MSKVEHFQKKNINLVFIKAYVASKLLSSKILKKHLLMLFNSSFHFFLHEKDISIFFLLLVQKFFCFPSSNAFGARLKKNITASRKFLLKQLVETNKLFELSPEKKDERLISIPFEKKKKVEEGKQKKV